MGDLQSRVGQAPPGANDSAGSVYVDGDAFRLGSHHAVEEHDVFHGNNPGRQRFDQRDHHKRNRAGALDWRHNEFSHLRLAFARDRNGGFLTMFGEKFKRFMKEVEKERAEHPKLPNWAVQQIARDHLKKIGRRK